LAAAWGKKHQAIDDFLIGHNGVHLLVPFECELCIFRKLKSHNPIPRNPVDKLLLSGCIHRANLDTFWSQAKSTAISNQDKVAFKIKMSAAIGLQGSYEAYGPLPDHNHCGYEMAFEMLMHLRHGGSYSDEYTQFDTIQKLWSSFSNYCHASAKSN
jgi:hypothetical protein